MSMHYTMDIETRTVIYLCDPLGTRMAHDPQVTAFLSCRAARAGRAEGALGTGPGPLQR